MRHLIITADDLGADEARNAGILEAVRAGMVTSVSLLPNGPALEAAVEQLHALHPRNISLGIHWNLTEGKPLSADLPFLTGADGSFLGKARAHQMLMRRGDRRLEQAISKELTLQVDRLKETGLSFDHVDGHQHVHVFPAVAKTAARVARKHRIPWVRIPIDPDPPPWMESVPTALRHEASFFSGFAGMARPVYGESGFRATDHFCGLYLKGRLSVPILNHLLQSLKEGWTELMVHPGRAPDQRSDSSFSSFSTPDRERELDALLDPDFRLMLEKSGVLLSSFPPDRLRA